MNRSILVTGAAGFIGSHLLDRLLAEGFTVTAIDNFDPFYAREIKQRNLDRHLGDPRLRFLEVDITRREELESLITGSFDAIVHIAAKAGVLPSIQDPVGYYETNVRGTQNLLSLAHTRSIPQFVFASSSSVYGIDPGVPWREDRNVLRPISPYASTKVSGELLGHVYSHLFGIRFLALRFFTVYGPRQRPDLAIHKFARRMLEGDPIPFYGDGTTRRDYTYVDDVVDGVRAAIDYAESMYEVINLGNDRTISLTQMVRALEEVLGVTARLDRLPFQPGDVPQTWASIEKAQRLLGYRPNTEFEEGLAAFALWLGSKPTIDPGRDQHASPLNRL